MKLNLRQGMLLLQIFFVLGGKIESNHDKRTIFLVPRWVVTCLVTLSLTCLIKTHIVFFRIISVLAIFLPLTVAFRIKTELNKSSTKLQLKLVKNLPSRFTSLLLCIKLVQRNRFHFFKNFKTQCGLMFFYKFSLMNRSCYNNIFQIMQPEKFRNVKVHSKVWGNFWQLKVL